MSNITSTIKGDVFEEQVYKVFKDLLDNDDFYVSGKKSRIYRKKSYLSEKTKNEIVVDISIETYLEYPEKYSLLTIIECKNYISSIPVNDIREFSTILNEIGEHNTKGILVSNNSFQKGTIDYAVHSKIALVRINSENEIDWINHRKDRRYNVCNQLESKVVLSDDILKDKNIFGFTNNRGFERLPDFLIESQIIDKYYNIPKLINIPYISDQDIFNAIDNLSNDSFYDNSFLNTNSVCNKLTDLYDVKFNFDEELSNNILGKLCYNPLQIFITAQLKSDIHRWRFTLAHEIGHLILHYNILNPFLDENIDNDLSLALNINESLSYNKRMEIQSNIFASNLLVREKYLIKYVADYFDKELINEGYLYLDKQPINQRLVFSFLSELQRYFGVSKDVLKYKLIGMGLLKDMTDNSIRGILRREL